MKSILKKLFIDNWQKKLLALILAIITWIFVNNSLIITKTINGVPIRIINLPKDKTIKGMLSDGTLYNTISIQIQGNKTLINPITKNDLEILIDLNNTEKEEYTTFITKNDLISKNPNIDIERTIKKLKAEELSIKLSNFVIEKIPLLITHPIGEVPKGYQLLDIWPYKLYVTVSGPEEIIKKLQAKGLKLTFNLNLITEQELDAIDVLRKKYKKDVINFFIPTSWKRLNIPELSTFPIDIDDPNSKALRIDFIKNDFIPINSPIPITLFFPNNTLDKLNPNNITLVNNDFVKKINGIDMITTPLYAEGVSELFVNIIKEKILIIILVNQNEEQEKLKWNVQIVLPLYLENYFIKKILIEENEAKKIQPLITEEYLKVRFRTYMHKFRLWISPKEKLNLRITLKNNKLYIIPVQK